MRKYWGEDTDVEERQDARERQDWLAGRLWHFKGTMLDNKQVMVLVSK